MAFFADSGSVQHDVHVRCQARMPVKDNGEPSDDHIARADSIQRREYRLEYGHDWFQCTMSPIVRAQPDGLHDAAGLRAAPVCSAADEASMCRGPRGAGGRRRWRQQGKLAEVSRNRPECLPRTDPTNRDRG